MQNVITRSTALNYITKRTMLIGYMPVGQFESLKSIYRVPAILTTLVFFN